MKLYLIILISLIALPIMGQEAITLQECYDLAAQNYPIAKQSQLIEAQNKLDTEIISNAKLPQFSIDAQATYQSVVIEIPIPNTAIERLNKDQYRATVSINQVIYNGGITDALIDTKNAQLTTKNKQVEVNLYTLKQQINQLYFSVLLAQENTLLLNAKKELLQSKYKEAISGVKYGVLLPASETIIKAELIKLEQQSVEIESSKAALIETLSSLISKPLNGSFIFEKPMVETNLQGDLSRPELALFQLKKEEVTSNDMLVSKHNIPKVMGFATGGYGNPGLNMLDNSFQPFYTVGVKLQWNPYDWNSTKKKRKSLSINKDIIDTETETFTLNTSIELDQKQKEIIKIENLIISDQEIIKLRDEILSAADSQLKNGVITSSAYITELTNLYVDQNTLIRHKIQLQLAKANYNVIKGL